MLGTFLDTGDAAVSKREKTPCSLGDLSSSGEHPHIQVEKITCSDSERKTSGKSLGKHTHCSPTLRDWGRELTFTECLARGKVSSDAFRMSF